MRLGQWLILKYIRTKFKLLSAISKRKAAEQAMQLFLTPRERVQHLPPVFEQAEKLAFESDGEIIRGYRLNHPSDKKVLILHGYESSVVNFSAYVHQLADKGYEVLAFDAPAHGNSTGRSITVLQYKQMIHQICSRYGPIKSFLSHSFGGLALSLVLEELPHDDSYKVVFIAPAAETTRAIDNFFRLLKLNGLVRLEFEDLIFKMGGKPSDWYSIPRAAEHIKARVLFLQDKKDTTTPLSDVVPIINKNYPNFHFILSEGLGHSRIYRDTNTIKSIMDFL